MGGGCCAVPPSASAEVAQVHDVAIAAIFFHTIALLALGLLNMAQWIASAIAILCSIGVLCRFRKGTYMAAVVGYFIAGFFDLVAVALWIIIYFAVREQLDDRTNDFLELNSSHSSLLSEESSDSNDVEESYDIPEWTQLIGWPALDFILDQLGATSDVILCLVIAPLVAAIVMYEGFRSSLAAVKKWKESGAPDAAQAV